MLPMLATPAQAPPTGPGWVHEVKWDGMRILADVGAGRVRLRARSGADATTRYPELGALASAVDDALLDGEVVALDDGRPSFARLTERIHIGDPAVAEALAASLPVTYMVFDVLRIGGHDITDRPWHVRRALLDELEWDTPRIHTPEVYDDGALLLAATSEADLEGVVSKRRSAVYAPGRRSPDWLKCAHRPTRSVVVGGWRPETGSGAGLGSVLVGVPGPGGLVFRGRVGSGFGDRSRAALMPLLRGSETDASPFTEELPPADARGTRWVTPSVVVDVRSLGAGGHGRLRQPVFRGLRTDLGPSDVEA